MVEWVSGVDAGSPVSEAIPGEAVIRVISWDGTLEKPLIIAMITVAAYGID